MCHAPTLSQARDNRGVNPSRVKNTFFELAQGFQTPVHTYNPYITGEYITKFGNKNTIRCVYIYISEVQTLTNTQPNGSILYKRRFNTTCYYKEIYLYNMLQRKYTPRTPTKYKQLPSTQESYTYYST